VHRQKAHEAKKNEDKTTAKKAGIGGREGSGGR
jgi:hypothetical protein